MARKVMQCKSAPEIELCFDGGEAILLRFDIRCLVNIQEFKGGLKGFVKKPLPEMAALVVYSAAKGLEENKDFTEAKARAIVSGMSPENILEIMKTFGESVGSDGANNEDVKKLVAQLLGAN